MKVIWAEKEYIKGHQQWDLRTPVLHIRVQFAGTWEGLGHYNWWVSPLLVGIFSEERNFLQGHANSETAAKFTALLGAQQLLGDASDMVAEAL